MTSLTRLVLDTNVVLSALVFGGGAAGRLRQGWQRGDFVPLVSTATAQELVRVLAHPKFRLSKSDQDELLADYLPYAHAVRISQPLPTVPERRDSLDVPFMHLAAIGKAQWLVSGDKDLLALAEKFQQATGCPIVTMDTFLNQHEKAQ